MILGWVALDKNGYYSIRGTKYVTLHFSIITVIVCCHTDREVCHIITSFLKKRPVPNIPETLYFLSTKYGGKHNEILV
jgi:hypothetical protein